MRDKYKVITPEAGCAERKYSVAVYIHDRGLWKNHGKNSETHAVSPNQGSLALLTRTLRAPVTIMWDEGEDNSGDSKRCAQRVVHPNEYGGLLR